MEATSAMRFVFVFALSLLLVTSLASAQVMIGSMPAVPASYNGMGPSTVIDLSHPATGFGVLTTASVRWNIGCANAFKLKFLTLDQLSSYSVNAVRGPFNAVSGTNVVTLSPPVLVQEGDVIAVTQVGSASCGGYFYSKAPEADMTMFFSGDIPDEGLLTGQLGRGQQLNVRASSDTSVCEGIIAAVGSTQGAFGSFFRTSVQLTNRDAKAATGKLIFHPAGQSGSASDPSLPYSIPPNSVAFFNDLIAAMGQTGLGSLDVMSTSGSRPLAVVRVFNDAGTAGSSGFTEEIVTPDNVLRQADEGYITMPADPANYRMNIGIRSGESGATIEITAVNASNGTLLPATQKPAYAANYFEQTTLQQFLNGVSPVANGVVRIRVKSGSVVIYASTTDNRTNDSSIDFVQRE